VRNAHVHEEVVVVSLFVLLPPRFANSRPGRRFLGAKDEVRRARCEGFTGILKIL
jgi:hypothetical protein